MKISPGYYTTLSIKFDNSLWASGLNNYGQIGDGTTIDKDILTYINCDVVGINELINHDNIFSIFPNPSNQTLNYTNTTNQIIDRITIIDITGKVLLEQKNINSKIDIYFLESGIYLLKILSEDKEYSIKFIKL